jgi:alanyl-tRNA synthetase
MTQRLDRSDAFLTEFDACVVDLQEVPAGFAVRLDRSAFYPGAGGQPNDTGTLIAHESAHETEHTVLDVFEKDGAVWHVLAAAPPAGAVVRGRIHWPRRFDHMQQHSGQHLLSQAFARRTGLDTIAVHIGAQECTLDLPTPTISIAALDAVEDDANTIVHENRPLRVYEVDESEISRVPLRAAPKVRGRIRIVEIEEYDWSACGGTHVRSTGQIGLIKLLRAEKRAETTRVTFLCGARALRDYRAVHRDASDIAAGMSVARAELPQTIARLRDEARASAKALAAAQAQLDELEAHDLLAAAVDLPSGARAITAIWDDRDAASLRAMARRLTAAPGTIALLAIAGERAQLCFARSRDVALDVAPLLRAALQSLGGAKGGGAPDFAQGGGIAADHATLQNVLENHIRELMIA